jgi:hypothetical protein
MTKRPETIYKYRAFNFLTLDSLCNDTLSFASPDDFNDPLDCKPTLQCDSSAAELRKLLAEMIRARESYRAAKSIRVVPMKKERARSYIKKHAESQVEKELSSIAYYATDPDYTEGPESAELHLLTEAIKNELLRTYIRGVCCFSSTYDNPLLWSHYGDQHKGLCVGYSLDREPKLELHKVVYGGERSISTSVVFRALIEEDPNAGEELDRSVLLRKARDWSYEKEWRIVDTQGSQDSPLLLKEITFGLRCPSSVKHSVISSLSGRDKPAAFYEIREAMNRYSLRRHLVDVDELGANFPRTAMSGMEMFDDASKES